MRSRSKATAFKCSRYRVSALHISQKQRRVTVQTRWPRSILANLRWRPTQLPSLNDDHRETNIIAVMHPPQPRPVRTLIRPLPSPTSLALNRLLNLSRRMISGEASASRTIEVNTWWIQNHDLVTACVVEDLPGTHCSKGLGAGCRLLSVLLIECWI